MAESYSDTINHAELLTSGYIKAGIEPGSRVTIDGVASLVALLLEVNYDVVAEAVKHMMLSMVGNQLERKADLTIVRLQPQYGEGE